MIPGLQRWTAALSLGLALALVAAVWPLPVRGDDAREVVIYPTRVSPEVLQASIEETVIFRNRSGRRIHVVFLSSHGMQHVSETTGEISAIFHSPGRHPYVVRFSDTEVEHLHGVIDVDPGRASRKEPPICTDITLMDVCIPP